VSMSHPDERLTGAVAPAVRSADSMTPLPVSELARGVADRARDRRARWNTAVAGAIFLAIAWAYLHLVRSRGLWLDEYGTLWVVGGSAAEVSERTYQFQGQSPLYYYAVWLPTQLFGMSELALRLPSLLFVLLASVLLGSAAKEWYGERAGLQARVFAWCVPPVLGAALAARPYSLALVGCACAWLGYARAVNGARGGRLLFVAGGALLFWAHYLLAVFLIGFVAAHVAVRALRARYSLASLLGDSLLVFVVCLPGLPHLHALWRRRGDLDWMPAPDNLAWVPLVLPALLTVAVALACRSRATWTHARIRGACAAIGTPLLLIFVGVHFGPNLTAERYLLPTVLGGILLAVGVISTLSPGATRPAVVLFLTGAVIVPAARGSLVIGMTQDWTSVRRHLDAAFTRDPGVLVLYRSGFVEEDAADSRRVSPADLAPLRPPGLPEFRARVIPLTFSWNAQVVERLNDTLPLLRDGRPVYYVSSLPYWSKTGRYDALLSRWIIERAPRVRAEVLPCCAGVQMIRFATDP
jgi:hypothetical protein